MDVYPDLVVPSSSSTASAITAIVVGGGVVELQLNKLQLQLKTQSATSGAHLHTTTSGRFLGATTATTNGAASFSSC